MYRFAPVTELHDQCLRAMTDDGGFRVMTVRTTQTVRYVLQTQNVKSETARWLADLVTGTLLVRETMSPANRVQGLLHGIARSGVLVADCHPDGGSRGLVQRRGDGDPLVGGGAVLEMMRTLHRGVHKGMVKVPDGATLSTAFMAYMQESEQVATVMAMTTLFDGDRVRASGGYLVQLLPELSEPMLAIMTERLKEFAPIEALLRDESTTPHSLMAELLYGMPFTQLADSPLQFQCRCDQVRIMASLATLPRDEVQSMVDDAKPLEITCDYCRRDYVIEPEQLRGLLAPS